MTGVRFSTARVAALLIAPLAVCQCSPLAGADAPRIAVAPSPARQGDCVFVFVRPQAPPAAGECRWAGRAYPLFPVGDGYRAVVPVSPDAPAGPHKLVIVLRDRADKVTQTPCAVTVVKRAFGVQKLSLTPSATRLYTDAEAEQERRTIHNALVRASAEQLWRGAFAWPCRGPVRTGFGVARTINGEIQYRHRGLDIGAAEGTPVVAPADGVVSLVREGYKLHGNTIALDHGQGVSSLYLHLSGICVHEGQRVARGEVIGKVGASGVATGPHLHWAVYVAGQAVEPRFWVELPQECRR